MTKDALLILNRKSAARPDVREVVKASNAKIEVVIPWDGKALRRAVRGAVKAGVPRIIAGGGDGTINKVANAILAHGASETVMGLLPLGTANDFARGFGDHGEDLGASLDRALSLPGRPVDVGRVNGVAFVNVASGGFGAMITATTDKTLKRQFGGLAYTLAGLGRLSELTATPARIVLDDTPARAVDLLALAIGNSRYAGGGFDVAPEADVSDGVLDIGVLTGNGLWPDQDRMARLLDPDDPTSALVDRARFRTARLEADRPFHINLDGEPMVDTTFVIRVEPGALLMALPET